MEPIVGERVTLRPFREDELDFWFESLRSLGADAFPAGQPTRASARARIAGVGRERGEIDLAVEVDGRVVGDIQTQRPPGQDLPPGVQQIGIALFRPADRGRGYGSEAVGLLVDWLFRERGAASVQAGTAPTNSAMRRLLGGLGFEEVEPVLVFGQPHLLYAVTREAWKRRPGSGRAGITPSRE